LDSSLNKAPPTVKLGLSSSVHGIGFEYNESMATQPVLSAQSTPLIEQLLDLPEAELRLLATEHGIAGLLSHSNSYFGERETQDLFLKTYQQQLLKNILFLDEFKKINQNFYQKMGTSLTPLKGLSLLQTLYEIGDRPMTDMDVYTPIAANRFIPFFQMQGYELKKEKTWYFNQHKWVFIKKTETLDFTLEVHTQLLPQDRHWKWSLRSDGRLDEEEEFLYLVAHWAQQHTCLKLFWLFDLYFFARKNPHIFRNELWQKAQHLRMTQSLAAAAWALELNFKMEVPKHIPWDQQSPLFSRLMSSRSLLFLPQNRILYLILKHYLKETFWEGITYDVLWAKNRLENHFSKYKKNLDNSL
jgi:Uncharacterised nucleotidyltransferase